MACLEAAEELCRDGFTPGRTVYFAFGGDEEVTGLKGAKRMAKWFSDQQISFDWMWDEGAITTDGIMPGIRGKLSLVGTAEKGQVNILLKNCCRGRRARGNAAETDRYRANRKGCSPDRG